MVGLVLLNSIIDLDFPSLVPSPGDPHIMEHPLLLGTIALIPSGTFSSVTCEPHFYFNASSTPFQVLPQHHAFLLQFHRPPSISPASGMTDGGTPKAAIRHHLLLVQAYSMIGQSSIHIHSQNCDRENSF